jgi:chromosome segregation ATPase
MKERKRILTKINEIKPQIVYWKIKLDEIYARILYWKQNLEEINLEYEEYKKKIKDIEKEFEEKINKFEKEIEEKMKNIQKKPEEKIRKLEKEYSDCEKEKTKISNKMKDLEAILIKNGIAVPEELGYEISNGLLGMKRDINIKLTDHMTEQQIRQVFFFLLLLLLLLFSFLCFTLYFLVFWNKLRILYLEKSFSFSNNNE